MSQLLISANYTDDIKLNVVMYQTIMSQNIPTVQTKSKAISFPHKVTQPKIRFLVVFRNEQDYEAFQNFVRKHHLAAIGSGNDVSSITMWWPEQRINNWTGYIREFQAGGERFNPVPRADFTVELVDSFISRRTTLSSLGSPFSSLFGLQIDELRRDWWRNPSRPSTQNPPPAIGTSGNTDPIIPLPQPGGFSFGDAGNG